MLHAFNRFYAGLGLLLLSRLTCRLFLFSLVFSVSVFSCWLAVAVESFFFFRFYYCTYLKPIIIVSVISGIMKLFAFIFIITRTDHGPCVVLRVPHATSYLKPVSNPVGLQRDLVSELESNI